MSTSSNAPTDLLQPMLTQADDWSWTLHYPMYLNTFCLAYHLAQCLASLPDPVPEIRSRLVRNEWWRGRPRFNYRADIEIFVGVDSTVEELNQEGHDVDAQEVIEFTRYKIEEVFLRRERPDRVPAETDKILLVTDIETTAKKYLELVEANHAAWPDDLGVFNRDAVEIRNSWERELADVFAPNRKLYMFGAPMTDILRRNADKEHAKYEAREARVPAVSTAYIIRSNRPRKAQAINAVRRAIQNYYECVFDPERSAGLITDDLADAYARMAMTAGEANPFADLYSSPGGPVLGSGKLAARYLEILDRHHAR